MRSRWARWRAVPLKFLAVAVLALAPETACRAAEQAPPQEVNLEIGAAQPISDIAVNSMGDGKGRDGAPGVESGLQYFYDPASPKFGVGFDLDYLQRMPWDSHNLIPNASSDVSGQSYVILAAIKYRLDTEVISAGTPYVEAGVGAGLNSTVITAQPEPYSTGWVNTGTYESRELVDDSRWVPAASVKFGMDFQISARASLGAEVGWTGLADADYDSTAAGKAAGIGCPTTGFASMLGCSGSSGHQYSIINASGPLNLLTIGLHWNYKF